MYISDLHIKNFRCFNSRGTSIQFNEGINVIIGHNNAGKTTILKALDILFNSNSLKKMTIYDFNRSMSLEEIKDKPPHIYISAKLSESENENQYSDELVTVSEWLVKLDSPYQALITFVYYLPDNELENYRKVISNITSTDINIYWKAIEENFLKKYVGRMFVGNPNHKNTVSNNDLSRFDFQFLSAIRDVERDLFKGNSSLLREIIDFYMDYDIKNDNNLSNDQKTENIQNKKEVFSRESNRLIQSLKERMSKGEDQILKYVHETGAGIDSSKPIFDGAILDTELYSALRLLVEKRTGIKIPATSNGLGYNNLLYISLLLSKMQKDASGEYLGSNSKVFSLLAIEEPEAHLHPSMQYKFLQFIKNNIKTNVRQIFVTSHSPNITAAVDLEDIIVIQKEDEHEEIRIAYPSKIFDTNLEEDKKSLEYVKRFLDVTKADLFFAKNIILVEGIAEQLLLPAFSAKLGLSFEDSHTTVINIGGRYFEHFLKLFNQKNSPFAIHKKVACLTDLDPVRKKISESVEQENTDKENNELEEIVIFEESNSSTWQKCPPIFLDKDSILFEYKLTSNKLVSQTHAYSDNIKIFTQPLGISCTLEYEIARINTEAEGIFTNSFSNQAELRKLQEFIKAGEDISKIVEVLRKSKFKEELQELLSKGMISNTKINKEAIFSYRYLMSTQKGVAAQEFCSLINNDTSKQIITPEYIKEAIHWITQ